MARTLEQQLADIEDQFKTLSKASNERASAFKDVSGNLAEFHEKLDTTRRWFQSKINSVQSNELNSLPNEEARDQIAVIIRDKTLKEKDIEELKGAAIRLREDPRTGGAASVNRAVSELERAAALLDTAMAEKEAKISQIEKQGEEFESAKTLMFLWLAQMEARVDEFQPVGIMEDIVEKQIAQLQVRVKSHAFT